MKNLIIALIITAMANGVLAQNDDCKCKLLYRYYDSTTAGYGGVTLYEYPNDSLLVTQIGGILKAQEDFSFSNFINWSKKNDSIIVRDGNLYSEFLGRNYLFLSRRMFDKKQKSVRYILTRNYTDTNKVLVVRTVYLPKEMKKIDDKLYFVYETYSASLAIYLNQVSYKKMSRMKETVKSTAVNVFIINEHSHATNYYVPGKGYLISYSGMSRDHIGKYIETKGCEQFLKQKFKSWY